MSPLRDHLRREVASLYSFVESISHACDPAPQSSAYPESSSKFFEYIVHLADCTKKRISDFEAHAEDPDDDFQEARAELQTIRAAWRELHRFIKPSVEADTLNQPTAMAAALVDRLRKLKGFEDSDFVLFHTDTFDYLQINPGATGDALDQLARIVDANRFGANLGLIGLPNSQGGALFMNCLLAHEIGEYVYAKRGVEKILGARAAAALLAYLGEEFAKLDRTQQSRLTQTVVMWGKELFCDLFAVRFVGPCYSFAYIELFDLPNLLDKSSTRIVDEIDKQPQIRFYRSHPSHPFRVKAQIEMLKSEGWWDFIKDLDCRSCAVLRALLDLKPERFIEVEEAGPDPRVPLLKALNDLMSDIRKEVVHATDGIDPGLHEYRELWLPITEYLRSGVVPSTLVLESDKEEHSGVHPTATTLLNAAYRFYLVGVEDLMLGINAQDPALPERRAFWMKKIENWTAKALEDIALLRDSTT